MSSLYIPILVSIQYCSSLTIGEPFDESCHSVGLRSCGARHQPKGIRRRADEGLPGIRFGLGNHKSSRDQLPTRETSWSWVAKDVSNVELDDTPKTHNILQAEAEMTHDLIYGFQDHWCCWILCPFPICIIWMIVKYGDAGSCCLQRPTKDLS